MNQIADILKLAGEAAQQNVDAVLATVVRTEGSAYRRAGAMMLICADGRSVGMISGGCLEPHIIKRAFWLTRNGANVQVYQTGDDIEYTKNGEAKAAAKEETSENDFLNVDFHDEPDLDLDELNFGLGCNGRVHVLFERLATATPLLDTISQVRHTQQSVTIATLIRSASRQNSNPELQIGMRIDLDDYTESGQIMTIGANGIGTNRIETNNSLNQSGSDASNTLINTVENLAQYELGDKNAEYVVIKSEDSKHLTTEWLVQRLEPQIRLLICGAGNDVMPLVTMAKLQDWHVTVIDSRAQYATRMRFPQADEVLPLALEDTDTLLKLSHNAAVALMSHSLSQDRARLAVLLAHANHYKYLGQLGPRYRTERLIEEISATNVNPASLSVGINKLHYPIGYKLGGDGPEALALGIMAQINTVMHNQASPAKCVDLANSNIAMMGHA
ncbi:XdhC family protein [Psychrobacter sp. H8-1]|uniref:XdhC family protein n=1 Tax=Psychrobacter sp. H8-1 TaxID=2774129 RepID=UPI00191AEF81|nr:XdhC/CoxI family protein [Psychrobacter sp. H8-1]